MKRPKFIAEQSARPVGILGRVIASIMERETAALNRRAVQSLNLSSRDVVLEVGFGHGLTIESLAATVRKGHVAGVDVSDLMTRVAQRRNRTAVKEGRVELHTADCAALPFPNDQFTKCLCVNTIYFWPDPVACLREIRRVLRPEARLVLAFTPKDSHFAANFPEEVYNFYDPHEVEELLAASGFDVLEMDRLGEARLALATASSVRVANDAQRARDGAVAG